MRLLVFHNILWSQYKSVVFEKLNAELIQKNSELLVVQTSITEETRKDLINFDVDNFPFKYNFRIISTKTLENVSRIKMLFYRLYYIFQFKPTTINLTGYNEFGTLFILILCRILSIKSIITNESISISKDKNALNFIKFYYKILLFKLTDGFFSYGIKSNTYLFKHQVDKNKIFSFLNTFDKSKFATNTQIKIIENNYLLFVGRLSEEKNVDGLILLFNRIKEQIPGYQLIIIGGGPEKENLQIMINDLALADQIKMLGSIQWEQLSTYFQHAECLILPSKSEPWGMVANEAQEKGIPVICSQVCGCSDDLIIDNYSGIIINDMNLQESDQKIVDFLINRNKLLSQKFIAKNNNIFTLNRLSMEMLRSL
jgi:glycosyltransferase involved in cell wall biosynthesis